MKKLWQFANCRLIRLCAMGFWLQLKLLIWKNCTMKKRKPFVLLMETLMLVTFLLLCAVVRIIEQPMPHEPQRFRAYALPSAGILTVLHELCHISTDEMDENGFLPDNNFKFQNFLNSFDMLGNSERFMELAVSPKDIEEIPKTFRLIAESSVTINEFINSFPGTTISDIARNPNVTMDQLVNALTLSPDNLNILFESPLNMTEVAFYAFQMLNEFFMPHQIRSLPEENDSFITEFNSGFFKWKRKNIYHHVKKLIQQVNPVSIRRDIDKVYRNVRVLLLLNQIIQKVVTFRSYLLNTTDNILLDSLIDCNLGNVSINLQNLMANMHNISHTVDVIRNYLQNIVSTRNDSNPATLFLLGNAKILYAPKNTDVDKIIKQVNKTLGLSFLETMTEYAVSCKTLVVEMRRYLQDGYTESNEHETKKVVSYLEMNSKHGADVFDKERLEEYLQRLDMVASAWLHFVSKVNFDFFIGFHDENALISYAQNQAQKDNIQVFAGLSFVMNGDGSLPQHVTYSIRQNASFFPNTKRMKFRRRYGTRSIRSKLYYYSGFIFLQDLVDRAIVSLHGGRDVLEPGSYVQELPLPCYSEDKLLENLEYMLPLCSVFSWVFLLAILVQNIVHEKEFRLKEIMKVMGMSELVHFVSWFFTSLFFVTLSCLLMTAILVFGSVFPNSDFTLIFVILLLYGFSIIALSFLLSSLFSKAKVASACAGIVYFLMYVPSMYVTIQITFNNKPLYIWSMAAIFLICPTTFAHIMTYIIYYEEMGSGAKWSNLHTSPIDKDVFSMRSIILFLPLDSLLYLVITWYIINVHPGNYGLPRPWYFPFTKSYWLDGFVWKYSQTKKRSYRYSYLHDSSLIHHEMAIPVDEKIASTEYNNCFEPDPEHITAGVCIVRLGKYFGKAGEHLVIKDLSLNFFEGQITAFLGHNGAGKTTTLSILTGILPPSLGKATIYGLDIRHDMNKIRQNLGICPQHNVLFNELTVEEHIRFYARLKGVPAINLVDEIEKIIHDAGLTNQRMQYVACLGGGMKRILSVAIAFIGGSKTVILDEPTSGIDPYSRRAIWDLIIKYKTGRTIILSTHHMDEAETLGDRVAIIANGRLKCCGSPVYLKNNLGMGYHLHLAKKVSSDDRVPTLPVYHELDGLQTRDDVQIERINKPNSPWANAITSFIKERTPTAQFVSESHYELHYLLPVFELKVGNFETLFGDLDKHLDLLHISTYGVKSPTLEEVFLQVSSDGWGHSSGLRMQTDREQVKRIPDICSDNQSRNNWVASERVPSYVSVGFIKNRISSVKHLTSRLRKRSCMYQPLPVNLHEDVELGNDNEDINQLGFGVNKATWITCCRTVPFLQLRAIIKKRFLCTRRNVKGLMTQIVLPAIFVGIAMAVAIMVPSFDDPPPLDLSTIQFNNGMEFGRQVVVFSNAHQDEEQLGTGGGASSSTIESTLLLASGIGASCVLKSRHLDMVSPVKNELFESSCPQAVSVEDVSSQPNAHLQHHKTGANLNQSSYGLDRWRYHPTCHCTGTLYRSFICSGDYEDPPFISIRTGEILLNISRHKEMDYFLNTQTIFREQRYGALSFGLARKTNFQNQLAVRHSAKAWYDGSGFHAMPIFVNSLNNAILRANLPAKKGNPAAYGITTINHPLPNTNSVAQYEQVLMATNLVIAIFVITAMAFVPASFILNLVYERHSKAKHLHLVAGVTPVVYWTGNFLYDLLNYLIPATCCLMIFILFDIPAYTADFNLMAVILLFLFYGWAMIPAMYPFSFHFDEPSVAFLFLVVLNLFLGLTCMTSVLTLMTDTTHEVVHKAAELFDNLFIIFPNYCLGKGLMDLALLDYKNYYFIKIGKPELVRSPFSWNYIPKKLFAMAISGIIFFCITLFCERMSRKQPKKQNVRWNFRNEVLDADVVFEKQRVLQGGAKQDALQLVNLTKVFHTKKNNPRLAVDNICVGVPKGECFGLVGVNGAGKTTTFLMLTGDTDISSGDAFINGHSVVSEFETARRFIGYCPQFDALYDELTAREHLLIYACYHGIPKRRHKKVVNWALKKLDLMPYADQQSHTFSGGTKRKLSTALALLGSPSIIFLDEPTTGMDPRSKRFLWDVILGVVHGPHGQSVVLTSHSMEECEALCDRLTVMVDGRFCCLGSVQYLKSRFGGGYSLSIRLHIDGSQNQRDAIMHAAAAVDEFVATSFPNATLKESHSNVLHYELKASDVSLSYVFSCLEAAITRMPIEDYSICQNTLDNVFINFVEEQASSS